MINNFSDTISLLVCFIPFIIPGIGFIILIYLLTRKKPGPRTEVAAAATPTAVPSAQKNPALTMEWLKEQQAKGNVSVEELIKQLEEQEKPQKSVAEPMYTETAHVTEPASAVENNTPVKAAPKDPSADSLLLANVLLYLGAGLVLFAVIVLVSFEWRVVATIFKAILLFVTSAGFYITGMFMHGKEKFRRAGGTFIFIGLLTTLFTGLGLWNFGLKSYLSISGISFEQYWLIFALLTHPLAALTYWKIRTPGFLKIYLLFVYILNFAVASATSTDLRFRTVVFAVLNLVVYTVGKTYAKQDKFIAQASAVINQILELAIFIVAFEAIGRGGLDLLGKTMLLFSLSITSVFDAILIYHNQDNKTLFNLFWTKLIAVIPLKLSLFLVTLSLDGQSLALVWAVYAFASSFIVNLFAREKILRFFQFGVSNFMYAGLTFFMIAELVSANTIIQPTLQLTLTVLLSNIALGWWQNRHSIMQNMNLVWATTWITMLIYTFVPTFKSFVPLYTATIILAGLLFYKVLMPGSKTSLRSAELWLTASTVLTIFPFFFEISDQAKAIIFTIYLSLLLVVRRVYNLEGPLVIAAKFGEAVAVIGQLIAFNFAVQLSGDMGSWIMFVPVTIYWMLLMVMLKPDTNEQPEDLFLSTYGFIMSILSVFVSNKSLEAALISLVIVIFLVAALMLVKRIGVLAGICFSLFLAWCNLALIHYKQEDLFILVNVALVAAGFFIAWSIRRYSDVKVKFIAEVERSLFAAAVVFQALLVLTFSIPVLISDKPEQLIPYVFVLIGLLTWDNRNVRDWAFAGLVPAAWGYFANVVEIKIFADATANLYFIVPAAYLLVVAGLNFVRKQENWAKFLELAAFGFWGALSLFQSLWLTGNDRLIIGLMVVFVSVLFAARSAISGKLHLLLFLPAIGLLTLQLLVLFYAVLLAIPWWIYLGGFGIVILVAGVWLVYRTTQKKPEN